MLLEACAAGRSPSAISTSAKADGPGEQTPVYAITLRALRKRHLARAGARLQRFRGGGRDDASSKSGPPSPASNGAETAYQPSSSRSAMPRTIAPSGRISRASVSSACSLDAALRACGSSRSSGIGALRRSAGSDTPIPIRRNFVPSISFAEQVASAIENAARELGRIAERAGAGADLEIRGLELQRHGRAAQIALAFSRAETRLAQLPQIFSSGRSAAMSVSKVVSADTLLASRSGTTLRWSMPRASRHSRWPSAP